MKNESGGASSRTLNFGTEVSEDASANNVAEVASTGLICYRMIMFRAVSLILAVLMFLPPCWASVMLNWVVYSPIFELRSPKHGFLTRPDTGYSQVVEEQDGLGNVACVYSYGLDLISMERTNTLQPQLRFYQYDGHGSVRALTDAAGFVTDAYEYDAYGILVNREARNGASGLVPAAFASAYTLGDIRTQNAYLYCGEQFDEDMSLYFLRARLMNTQTGRFINSDNFEGLNPRPSSLHKYLYADSNPATFSDPSGRLSITYTIGVAFLVTLLADIALTNIFVSNPREDIETEKRLGSYCSKGEANKKLKEAYEVFRNSDRGQGTVDVSEYFAPPSCRYIFSEWGWIDLQHVVAAYGYSMEYTRGTADLLGDLEEHRQWLLGNSSLLAAINAHSIKGAADVLEANRASAFRREDIVSNYLGIGLSWKPTLEFDEDYLHYLYEIGDAKKVLQVGTP